MISSTAVQVESLKDSRYEAFRRLVGMGAISDTGFQRAVEQVRCEGLDLEVALRDGGVSWAQMGQALAQHYGCAVLSFEPKMVPSPSLFATVRRDYLRRHRWVPLCKVGTRLTVAIDDPSDLDRVVDIRYAFPGLTVELAVSLRRDINRWLDCAERGAQEESVQDIVGELVRDDAPRIDSAERLDGIDENNSAIVRLTNQIIADANRLGASDIHIEPYSSKKDLVVRFRVDGSCFTYMKVPAAYRRAVVSRIKIMANLDIAESRKPQDGKIRFRIADGTELELRVATLPTAGQNEDVVLRLLTSKGLRPLEEMDLSPAIIASLSTMVTRPYGILLCVGPTGSGKTTMLHGLLARINDDQRKIWTVEDPVEITQEGLRQLQVHPKIGLTFATALRAFLRADPDVIMVGEMRDKETADIAIEASLTGHLVLSTLHTNTAVETVTRLLDMGCDAFNFSDAMIGVLAKRLCRRLCVHCKQAYSPSEIDRQELRHAWGAFSNSTEQGASKLLDHIDMLWKAGSCDSCNGTGFSGRLALYELLEGTDEMKMLIQAKATTPVLLQLAQQQGMKTLLQDGIMKVVQGHTTLHEVRKVAFK